MPEIVSSKIKVDDDVYEAIQALHMALSKDGRTDFAYTVSIGGQVAGASNLMDGVIVPIRR